MRKGCTHEKIDSSESNRNNDHNGQRVLPKQ